VKLAEKKLYNLLESLAREEGFVASGGADWDTLKEIYSREHGAHFERWLDDGHHGEMTYLERGREKRLHPTHYYPDLKSVFVVLDRYSSKPLGDGKLGPRFARYLSRTPDYHEDLKVRLRRVLTQSQKTLPDLEGLICVDTSPVLERAFASLVGLGWIGKNTLLIHPQYGSYTFIGVMLLNQPLDRSPKILSDYCGNCERCLKACPTQAFSKPRVLESKKCISYQTLERKGVESSPPEVPAALFGTWVAGCDVCQEVCPFNRKATLGDENLLQYPPQTYTSLRGLTKESYREWSRRSALSRIKWSDFRYHLERAYQNSLRENVNLSIEPGHALSEEK
jgi:epoxyqueuosine reductase